MTLENPQERASGGGTETFCSWTSLVNTTPIAMTVRATVAQAFDWVSPNRPDLNLAGKDGTSVALGAFADLTAPEEVAATAETAVYRVDVSVLLPEDLEAGIAARIDRFSFEYDQCALKPSTRSKAQPDPSADTFFGDPVKVTTESGPAEYFVYRLVGEAGDKSPQVSFYISDREVS